MWATYRGGSWLGNEPAVLQLQSGDLTKIVSPCIPHFCEFRTKPNLLQPQHCGLRHTRRGPCEVLSFSCCSTVRANITEVDAYASMTKRCWSCIGWFPMVPALWCLACQRRVMTGRFDATQPDDATGKVNQPSLVVERNSRIAPRHSSVATTQPTRWRPPGGC